LTAGPGYDRISYKGEIHMTKKTIKEEYQPGGAKRHVILDKAVEYLKDPKFGLQGDKQLPDGRARSVGLRISNLPERSGGRRLLAIMTRRIESPVILINHWRWLEANGYKQEASSCKRQAASLTRKHYNDIVSYKIKENKYGQ
jgi:hypothetical protein